MQNARYRHIRYILIVLVAVTAGPFLAQADSGRLPSGVKTLLRTADPVVVTPQELSGFAGCVIANLGLFRVASGEVKPVPFQVDEKNEEEEWVFTAGNQPNPEDGNGLFDGADELVFIAKDIGDRAAGPEMFSGLDGVKRTAELVISDHEGHAGYVYLIGFAGAAPRAGVDYVSYNPDEKMIATEYYRMGFHPACPIGIGYLAALPAAGGKGFNPVDRMKIRGKGKTVGITLRRNEEDFVSKDVAYIDGPVRIVRRSKNYMKLPLGIPTPSAVIDNIFYRDFFYFPTEAYVPFNPVTMARWVSYVVSGATAYTSIDLCEKAKGTVFYNANNTEGTVIDGRMSEKEKNLDRGFSDWLALMHKDKEKGIHFGWVSQMIIDEQVATVLKNWLAEKYPAIPAPPKEGTLGYYARLKKWLKKWHPDLYRQWQPGLYYCDDKTHEAPPEACPGSYGDIGFVKDLDEFVAGLPEDLPSFESGIYRLTNVLYCVPGYELGDEVRYLNIIDRPLQVSVQDLGDALTTEETEQSVPDEPEKEKNQS